MCPVLNPGLEAHGSMHVYVPCNLGICAIARCFLGIRKLCAKLAVNFKIVRAESANFFVF